MIRSGGNMLVELILWKAALAPAVRLQVKIAR
jgi:hypothetical protein